VNIVDDPPTVANPIADVEVDEDASNTIIDLSTVFTDTDNDPALIVKSVQSNSNPTLVTASISGNSLTLDYQVNQNGTSTITIRGTSGSLTVDDAFLVTVNAVDDPPTVANPIADVVVDEDAENTLLDLSNVFTDIDNNPAAIVKTVQENSDPTLVSAAISGNTLTLDYQVEQSGTATVTIRGSSGGLTVDDAFSVTVNIVDDAPILTVPGPFVFSEDDSLLFSQAAVLDWVEDPDDADSTLLLSAIHGTHVTAIFTGGVLKFKAPADWNGVDSLQIVAADSAQSADSAEVLVTVMAMNDAPVFIADVPPDTIVFMNTADTVLSINSYVQDVDLPADHLHWQIDVQNDSLLYQINESLGELTLSAVAGYTGSGLLYLTVSDDSSASADTQIVVKVIADPTGLPENTTLIPRGHVVYQNYPNPFNPSTRIRFGLPKTERVRIEIYNIIGQRITTVIDETRMAGYHVVEFDGGILPSGIYFYRIQADDFTRIKKMVLIR
jgi:hypothetical protein